MLLHIVMVFQITTPRPRQAKFSLAAFAWPLLGPGTPHNFPDWDLLPICLHLCAFPLLNCELSGIAAAFPRKCRKPRVKVCWLKLNFGWQGFSLSGCHLLPKY